MKKFICKILLFLGLFSVFACVLGAVDFFFVGNQHLGSFQASMIEKVARLQSIEGPKIILIGNSNLSFGMNSPLLEEAMGMPVVNMGLHGGLGNAFHEEMSKLGASEGDIVVLCHNYFSDDDTITDCALAWITIEKHTSLWPLIRTKDLLPMAIAYPNYFKDSLIRKICGSPNNIASDTTCYSRSAFNKYGDVVNRPEDDYYEFGPGSVEVPQINDTCINRINALNAELKERGATLVIAGYPIASGPYTPDAAEFDAFESELRASVDCPVISHYRDYLIPYRYFYDTCFHLTQDGADIRTAQLIQDLKQWLEG